MDIEGAEYPVLSECERKGVTPVSNHHCRTELPGSAH
jgi:hypothetical protein